MTCPACERADTTCLCDPDGSGLATTEERLREALRTVLMEMEHVLDAPVGYLALTPQQVMDLERGIKIARDALGMEAK
jgi:hypothetical protein